MDEKIVSLLIDYINKKSKLEVVKATFDSEWSSYISEEKASEEALRKIYDALGVEIPVEVAHDSLLCP